MKSENWLCEVWDAQQRKAINMHPKRALHLCTSYPTRFSYSKPEEKNQNGDDKKMPALPEKTETLPNGQHILVALKSEEKQGKYGMQTEVTCLVEGVEEKYTRIWIPHSSLKKIEEAARVGLVTIDNERGSWDVALGARFGVFVANGKTVALVPTPSTTSK